jgi:Fungal specific transcription factor domain
MDLFDRLLAIAVISDFAMNSILALSALHMTYATGNKDTLNLSQHYRKSASKGLQNALGNFTQGNCDAILVASLVLSWQATDWYVLQPPLVELVADCVMVGNQYRLCRRE